MRKHNESSRRYANSKKVTQLVNVEEHVEGFRQVREAHRRELIDDYVELISDLIRKWGKLVRWTWLLVWEFRNRRWLKCLSGWQPWG